MEDTDTQKKSKILCVDDNRATIYLYENFLSLPNYQVKTALSAEEGFELAKKFIPDLIISDVVMPGIDGLEFCKKVRSVPFLASSIFLLASSLKVKVEDAIEALKGGADDYIIKPFNKDELIAKINAFLRIKSLQDDLIETNQKLQKTLRSLEDYKIELEKKNEELVREKQMLENSLKQISLMVEERERTNKELEQLNKIREGNFNSLVNILSTLIESRRQYHRGHAKKMAEISTFIAQKFGLTEEEIRNIKIASSLHEIGKFGISDKLAMKSPKDYTEQEKDLLERHPVVGASLLTDYSGFEEVALIIRHCHEHVDGTGIPDNLKKDEIPIGSRIIAVAGIFDNIVNRSENGTVDSAFDAIEKAVGIKYDATVVYYLHQYAREYISETDEKTKETRIYELEPGMVLASDIFTKSGLKLVPKDTVLNDESINLIVRYNKTDPIEETVFIKG